MENPRLNFHEWLLLEKYMNNESSRCGFCAKPLAVQGLSIHSPVNNQIPQHIYEIGQLLICGCGRSRIWTNAVRNEKRLLAALLQNDPRQYYNGFCNDKFCAYCYGPIDVLKNGEMPSWESRQQMDRYGCRDKHLVQCQDYNQNIFFVPLKEDPVPDKILHWYKDHLAEFQRLANEMG